jgi:hypothetical protein
MTPEKHALEIMKELYEQRGKELASALKRIRDVGEIIESAECECDDDEPCPCCAESSLCLACMISGAIR